VQAAGSGPNLTFLVGYAPLLSRFSSAAFVGEQYVVLLREHYLHRLLMEPIFSCPLEAGDFLHVT